MSDPILDAVRRRLEEDRVSAEREATRQEAARRKANEPTIARIRAEANKALRRLADKGYPDATLALVWNEDGSTQEMVRWLIYYRVQRNYHADMDEGRDHLYLLSDGSIGWPRTNGFCRVVLEEAPDDVLANTLSGLERLAV